MDYYARISFIDFCILSWRFKKLWIQKKDSLMWLTNLLVALCAIVLTTIVSMKITRPAEVQKVEIISPVGVSSKDLVEISYRLSQRQDLHFDSLQLSQLLNNIWQNGGSQKVIFNNAQLDHLLQEFEKTLNNICDSLLVDNYND